MIKCYIDGKESDCNIDDCNYCSKALNITSEIRESLRKESKLDTIIDLLKEIRDELVK